MLPLKFRPLKESDLGFLYNSWLKSYRNSKLTKSWKNEAYFAAQAQTIEALLKRSDVRVAVDPDSDGHIYGYIVRDAFHPKVVHFLYVKQTFRRLGIARSLLSEIGVGRKEDCYTTHWKPVCRFLGIKELKNEA